MGICRYNRELPKTDHRVVVPLSFRRTPEGEVTLETTKIGQEFSPSRSGPGILDRSRDQLHDPFVPIRTPGDLNVHRVRDTPRATCGTTTDHTVSGPLSPSETVWDGI